MEERPSTNGVGGRGGGGAAADWGRVEMISEWFKTENTSKRRQAAPRITRFVSRVLDFYFSF